MFWCWAAWVRLFMQKPVWFIDQNKLLHMTILLLLQMQQSDWHLSAVPYASDGHLPTQNVMTNLCIIFVKLVEGAHFEKQDDIPVFLLDLPVLLL